MQIASSIYSNTHDSTIAILTPYSAQKEVIIEETTKVFYVGKKVKKERFKVATITESQGNHSVFLVCMFMLLLYAFR